MDAIAAVLERPGRIVTRTLQLREPKDGDLLVEIDYAGISAGTEKLLWDGAMPAFPGFGYPLVPGYESVGRVVDARGSSSFTENDKVFVPGAHAFTDARSFFGANARHLFVPEDRLVRNDILGDERGVLLALAATAHHALGADGARAPDLIIGHGTLGRLLARIAVARGMTPPRVWEIDAGRREGSHDYPVIAPHEDEGATYRAIYDCTGDATLVPGLIDRLEKGGELVLAGFYSGTIAFPFAPAFMREARLRIAAEWSAPDMAAVRRLLADGRLAFDGLVTHRRSACEMSDAYPQAFTDPACRKIVLDWSDC
ncbi:chlorophyll synthesis pathway protein BchC [Aurantiacibacter spongiae]|uniref:Chlorophyll synthesis pathway protein BchC n=1 Tax=Aurantiacibacter spongiae TaxID=2488860 RepID=A0A3N5DRF1_9SPHN|nr:chlorophyll synthesis pathway protein BchC [Aurantiacibacter spongiae]RPF71751.1 chlorophyll synthesis pathway protein BchC [Aurantiacibacter spongiae]